MLVKTMRVRHIAWSCLATLALSSSAPGSPVQTTVVIPQDLLIGLERTACYGLCPVYAVTIDAAGNVVYVGQKFVRVAGRQTDRIPLTSVAALADAVEGAGFFELRDAYRTIRTADGNETMVTDLPTTIVTVTKDGRSKRVEDYVGAPDRLRTLEQQIDETARTKRWVRIDEIMLQQLVREGWSPSADEKSDLLLKAVQHDDVGVVRALLALGADPNGVSRGMNAPPLLSVRSADAARALLDAGANPVVTSSGITPLSRAVYLDPAVTDVLVRAGAPVNQPIAPDGRTALWQAACVGNSGVVNILLKAGADPGVRVGALSAVECARREREAVRPTFDIWGKPPFVKDFDAVILALQQAPAKRKPF